MKPIESSNAEWLSHKGELMHSRKGAVTSPRANPYTKGVKQMKLNLTANNVAEQRIKEYLEQNASETLAEKINNGTPITKDGKSLINRKTLAGFFKWATTEARKLAEKGTNFACVDDNTVFGWAIHYFEEDALVGDIYNLDGTPYEAPKPKAPEKKAEKKAPTKTPTKPTPKAEAPKPEPKKAVILPTPKPDPTKKPTKNTPTDTDQLSIFDLF